MQNQNNIHNFCQQYFFFVQTFCSLCWSNSNSILFSFGASFHFAFDPPTLFLCLDGNVLDMSQTRLGCGKISRYLLDRIKCLDTGYFCFLWISDMSTRCSWSQSCNFDIFVLLRYKLSSKNLLKIILFFCLNYHSNVQILLKHWLLKGNNLQCHVRISSWTQKCITMHRSPPPPLDPIWSQQISMLLSFWHILSHNFIVGQNWPTHPTKILMKMATVSAQRLGL